MTSLSLWMTMPKPDPNLQLEKSFQQKIPRWKYSNINFITLYSVKKIKLKVSNDSFSSSLIRTFQVTKKKSTRNPKFSLNTNLYGGKIVRHNLISLARIKNKKSRNQRILQHLIEKNFSSRRLKFTMWTLKYYGKMVAKPPTLFVVNSTF